MTVKDTAFANNTLGNSYDNESDDSFIDILLLSSENSSTSAIFAFDTMIVKLTGSFGKIYPSGTSLASIYADGSATHIITSLELYNGSKLYGETVYSTGVSLAYLIYEEADPALEEMQIIYSEDDVFIGSTETTSDSTDSDYCVGFAGDDTFYGNAGGATVWDTFLGGAGLDTAVYRGAKSNYTISVATSSIWNHLTSNSDLSGYTVVDATSLDSQQQLVDVERLQFTDLNLALDTDAANSAGGIYRLYKAALDRNPDLGGLGYWIAQADAGTKDAVRMATDFTYADEFKTLYGVQTVDNYMTGEDITALVTKIYENVLDRAPDAGGRDYYVGQITAKSKTVGQVLAEISDSAENRLAVVDLIGTGIEYTPWVD